MSTSKEIKNIQRASSSGKLYYDPVEFFSHPEVIAKIKVLKELPLTKRINEYQRSRKMISGKSVK